MENLSALDILVFIIIGISTLMALVRGFAREISSLAGWVIAAYGTLLLGPLILPFVQNYITIAWAAIGVSYALLFLIILVICSLISSRLSAQLKNSSIGPLDRTLGFIFGAVRGFVIVCVAYMILVLIVAEDEKPAWLTGARLYPLLQTGAAAIMAIIPEQSFPVDRGKIDEAVSDGQNKFRDAATELLKDEAARQIDNSLGAQSNEKTQDIDGGKGYNQNDRAILDSLIQGTQTKR